MSAAALPVSAKRPFMFKELHHKLIKGVYKHYLMTADLLTLLYFRPTSKTMVQEELPEMVRRRYLRCFPLLTTKGNGTYIYYLGDKGIAYCADAGCDMDNYWLPKKAELPSYPVLIHTLELNSFLSHAAAFARIQNISLEMTHDFTNRKHPVKVTVPARVNGNWIDEPHTIIADALLEFTLQDSSRRWFLHEHDTGEESQKQVKKHLRKLVAFLVSEKYKTEWNASGITITYTTSGKRDRLENLRTWTRDVLLEHKRHVKEGLFGTAFSKEAYLANKRQSYSSYFRFTTIPKFRSEHIDTKTLFTAPLWYPPFGETLTSLFRL